MNQIQKVLSDAPNTIRSEKAIVVHDIKTEKDILYIGIKDVPSTVNSFSVYENSDLSSIVSTLLNDLLKAVREEIRRMKGDTFPHEDTHGQWECGSYAAFSSAEDLLNKYIQ